MPVLRKSTMLVLRKSTMLVLGHDILLRYHAAAVLVVSTVPRAQVMYNNLLPYIIIYDNETNWVGSPSFLQGGVRRYPTEYPQ